MEKDAVVTKKRTLNKKKIIKYYEGKPRGAKVTEFIKDTKMVPSTAHRNAKKLSDEGILRDITLLGGNRKYILSDIANYPGEKELQALKEQYQKARKDNNKKRMENLREQIKIICINKRVTDKEFIKFLIEEGKNYKKVNMKNDPNRERTSSVRTFRKCWGYIINKLLESKEEYNFLLTTIYEETTDYLRKIILDTERWVIERDESLDILKEYDYATESAVIHPEKFDVAFVLLQNPSTYLTEKDYPAFIRTIKGLILLYSSIKYIDCVEKLNTILDTSEDKNIAETVLELLTEIHSKNNKKAILY